jgi:hypothetical protein
MSVRQQADEDERRAAIVQKKRQAKLDRFPARSFLRPSASGSLLFPCLIAWRMDLRIYDMHASLRQRCG